LAGRKGGGYGGLLLVSVPPVSHGHKKSPAISRKALFYLVGRVRLERTTIALKVPTRLHIVFYKQRLATIRKTI